MKKMLEKRVRSPFPYYICAGCVMICGLLLPLYKLWGILLTCATACAGYFISKRFFPDIIKQIEPEPEYRTGIKELDDDLAEAAARLASLKSVAAEVADVRISAAAARMVRAGSAILSELNAAPEKARSMRRFLSFYLPTAEKLMLSYKKQAEQGFSGENIDEIKHTVEANADSIAGTFEKCLDSLYAGEALDLASDAEVLE